MDLEVKKKPTCEPFVQTNSGVVVIDLPATPKGIKEEEVNPAPLPMATGTRKVFKRSASNTNYASNNNTNAASPQEVLKP